jgi:hypothetical protein
MATEICSTCRGEGWLMDDEHEGEPCLDCQNPLVVGGTGLKGGELTPELRRQAKSTE